MKMSKIFALFLSLLLAGSLCFVGGAAAADSTVTGSASITFYTETPPGPGPGGSGGSGGGSGSSGGTDKKDDVKVGSKVGVVAPIVEYEVPMVSIMDPNMPTGNLGALPKTGASLPLPLLLVVVGAGFLIAASRIGLGQAHGQSASNKS